MSRDLRAGEEFRNKGGQMPPSPHWPLVPLSLQPLGITARAIKDTVIKISQSNKTDYDFILNKKVKK